MKRKELFWMLLPCLLLAGAGIYFWRHAHEPFQVVITEARVVPVTDRDVAAGYDTRVFVRAQLRGVPPEQSGAEYSPSFRWEDEVFSRRTGQKAHWPSGVANGYYMQSDAANGDVIRVILYKLNGLPSSEGAAELRLNARAVFNQKSPEPHPMPSETATVLLRPSGAPVKVPPQGKYRPFELLGFESYWSTTAGGQVVNLKILTRRMEPPDMKDGRAAVYLTDLQLLSDGINICSYSSYSNSHNEDTGITEVTPVMQGHTVPNTAKQVVFKANLSLNECHPLPITVVLRKNGANITRRSPSM